MPKRKIPRRRTAAEVKAHRGDKVAGYAGPRRSKAAIKRILKGK